MNKVIILIGGDPNSINTEIIYKTWNNINAKLKKSIYLIANYNLIKKQFEVLKYNVKISKIDKFKINLKDSSIKIIDVPLNFTNPFKVNQSNASNYVITSLNLAHQLALNKNVKGIINCPINKNLLYKSEKNNFGVTEFLANKCKVKKNSDIMMIYNKKLSVVPLTTHIPINKISKSINSSLIINKLNSLNEEYKKIFRKKPKICILGLNPHNGEYKKGTEEVLYILPAILKLKKMSINIAGPLVADTIFINNYKKFDVVVGMYHDQVLAPYKTLFHYNAINVTLGLSYVRVSPDHGTAIDIIKKDKASHISLLQCVRFINDLK